MSLKSLLPAAAALAVATVALTGCSQTANVSGGDSNTHVEIPAGTKTVVINGSNNHIEGEAVSEITVNGSANAIAVKSVQKVSFTGSNNSVQYEEGNAPQTGADSGANNAVIKN